ncbi:hypothetical protein NHX12_004351, partial [Muraenolepis orangiensis]
VFSHLVSTRSIWSTCSHITWSRLNDLVYLVLPHLVSPVLNLVNLVYLVSPHLVTTWSHLTWSPPGLTSPGHHLISPHLVTTWSQLTLVSPGLSGTTCTGVHLLCLCVNRPAGPL